MTMFVEFILALCGMIGLGFYEGLIVQLGMEWFVIPFTSFEGLPYLAYVGFCFVLTALRIRMPGKDEDYDDDPIVIVISKYLTFAIVLSLILGIMALIHLGV